jgi:hypothetical protein
MRECEDWRKCIGTNLIECQCVLSRNFSEGFAVINSRFSCDGVGKCDKICEPFVCRKTKFHGTCGRVEEILNILINDEGNCR